MDSIEGKRPWGHYEVLSDASDHKVKRITVFPGKRLSLQRHSRRDEHWFVVKGSGSMCIGEECFNVGPGSDINIPREVLHRIENTGAIDLCFIEVQTGDYFGEDDIERFEDDYGRA